MSSQMYECSECLYTGRRGACELHYIINHVRADRVPWQCSLCGFKNMSESSLDHHLSLEMHRRALQRNPIDHTVFMKSKNPYQVEVGRDILLCREDRPNYYSRSGYDISRSPSRQNGPLMNRSSYDHEYTSMDYLSPRRSRGRDRARERRRSSNYDRESKRRRKSRDNSYTENSDRLPIDESMTRDGMDVRPEGTINKFCGEVHSTTNPQADHAKKTEADDPFSGEMQTTIAAQTVDKLLKEVRQADSVSRSIQHRFDDVFDGLQRRFNVTREHCQSGLLQELQTEGQNAELMIETKAKQLKQESGQNDNRLSSTLDVHLSRTSADDSCMEMNDQDLLAQEGLEDKVSELILALEPLKNISKALIALDHHLRRLMPMLETILSQGHKSTTGSPQTNSQTTVNDRPFVNSDPRLKTS